MDIQFDSKDELILYYSITDHLNNIIDRKQSEVLMEKGCFTETIKELVRCAKSYQLYLSTGIEDFGKPLPENKGTVVASREVIAQKLLLAESKGDTEKTKELRMQ